MKKLLISALFLLAFLFITSTVAKAADGSYDRLRVGDYLNLLRNYDHLDTGSRVYDNGQLHISTDDYLFLDASQRVYLQNEMYFMRNYDGWQGTGSRLYDNGQFHIATDDFLYLDVSDTVFISNNLKINNGLNFGNGAIVDFSNANIVGFAPLSTLADDLDGKVSIDGDTMYGALNADGGLNIGGDYRIYSDGTSYIGGEMVLNGNAPLVVNATAYFYNGIDLSSGKFSIDYMGNSNIDGNMVLTGNATLTMSNTAFLYGGINGANGFVVNAEGGIFTNGMVDFSGASMTRVTNSASEPTCDANASGAIYFNTSTNNFWGCDGSEWKEFQMIAPGV